MGVFTHAVLAAVRPLMGVLTHAVHVLAAVRPLMGVFTHAVLAAVRPLMGVFTHAVLAAVRPLMGSRNLSMNVYTSQLQCSVGKWVHQRRWHCMKRYLWVGYL